MSTTVTCIDCARLKQSREPYTGLRFTCSTCKSELIYDGAAYVSVYEIGQHKVSKLRKIGIVDRLITKAHQENDNEASPLD